MIEQISYQAGFGNHFQTESLENALPRQQNSPQRTPYDLYAEQLNGSAFTAMRHQNLASWLYRIRPSVKHSGHFNLIHQDKIQSAPLQNAITPPTQFRWNPLPVPEQDTHFIDGMVTMVANGSVADLSGGAVHLYVANCSMRDEFFYNADGELVIVPEHGGLLIKTELGLLAIQPGEMVLIPRGIRFQVELLEETARGYVCENYGAPFRLPERGPIGANGLAEDRHFLAPTAFYEERDGDFKLIAKFNGHLWQTTIPHSPLDVVAWHGNYTPYKYDLRLFHPAASVLVDHSDPSIFTVLTSPSYQPGVANIDFVIFPERWMAAENTFRPPYYHRNIMSEFMGLIYGEYDAKKNDFTPGCSSLHNIMSGHGVDHHVYEKAVHVELAPERYQNTLAFMFESSRFWQTTTFALSDALQQADYLHCWQDLKAKFTDENYN